MQLAKETLAASGGGVERSAAGDRANEGSSVACRLLSYAPVLVRGFYGGAIKDREDQQQSEATFERGALVLNCANQHAGHCRMC